MSSYIRMKCEKKNEKNQRKDIKSITTEENISNNFYFLKKKRKNYIIIK